MTSTKKIKQPNINPLTVSNLKTAYQMGYAQGEAEGFNKGIAEQRKMDIQSVVKLLKGLEELPGIGEKTAWKIRELIMDKFGV